LEWKFTPKQRNNSFENPLDLIVFINGLPIITFELKNELTRQTVKDAIKQFKTNRDPKEELFRLGRCLLHFAVDREQVWMKMINHIESNFEVFKEYNDNPEFKAFSAGQMFKILITDLAKAV